MLVEQVMKNLCEMFIECLAVWPKITAPIYVESVAITGRLPGLRDSKITGRCHMLKRYIAIVLCACVLWPLAAEAAPIMRYQADIHGDFVMIGGPTAHDCSAVAPASGTVSDCGGTDAVAGSANNFWRSDVTPPRTRNSYTIAQANTTLQLTLPAGAVVNKAYLYWGGTGQNDGFYDNTATISRTGTGAFTSNVTASQYWTSNLSGVFFYQAVADVTTIIANNVRNYGAGAYRASKFDVYNFPANQNQQNNVSGWWMVVFYELATEPLRNLVVFDGLDMVDATHTPVTANLTGFEVPNAGFDGKLGVVTYEGDSAITGDSLSFGGTTLSNALNPSDNFFNSTRSYFGSAVQVTGDLPRLTGAINSQSGMDFDLVNIKPYLTAGQTSAQIQAASTQDRFWLGCFVTSIATYRPNFASSTLTAVDVNGPPLLAGDILEYTSTIVNNGNDASLGTVLRIPLPAMVNDVSGSLQIVSGANTGAKTDAIDTDQGQYDSATRTIYFNLGTGATGSQGGRMAIGDTAVVRFRVQVMPGFSGILDIQATIGASGELGAPQDQTPTDGNGGDPGAPPTEAIIDECVTDANCSSPEPLCNTGASPKACVQCLETQIARTRRPTVSSQPIPAPPAVTRQPKYATALIMTVTAKLMKGLPRPYFTVMPTATVSAIRPMQCRHVRRPRDMSQIVWTVMMPVQLSSRA